MKELALCDFGEDLKVRRDHSEVMMWFTKQYGQLVHAKIISVVVIRTDVLGGERTEAHSKV
jgi:hypothetical protein